jgi:hypothetical protein
MASSLGVIREWPWQADSAAVHVRVTALCIRHPSPWGPLVLPSHASPRNCFGGPTPYRFRGTPPSRSSPLLAKESPEQWPHLRELWAVVWQQVLGCLPTLIIRGALIAQHVAEEADRWCHCGGHCVCLVAVQSAAERNGGGVSPSEALALDHARLEPAKPPGYFGLPPLVPPNPRDQPPGSRSVDRLSSYPGLLAA